MQSAYRSGYLKTTGRPGAVVAVCAAACALLLAAAPSAAQTAANVAVVINDAAPASQQVGDYYIAARGIPTSNVIRITTSTDETIERAQFQTTIQDPIAQALMRGQLQDRVLYIVLTKGVPLKIRGTSGPDGTQASVDSELTLLYRRMVGETVLTRGRVNNPYFAAAREPRSVPAFSRRDLDIYLVTRLDGFTVDHVKALIDRGKAPVRDGRIALDQSTAATSRVGDQWLAAAAERLSLMGQADRVLIDATSAAVQESKPLMGLYSWGSTDPVHRTRDVAVSFAPGAIAATFVSNDARTFKAPPDGWVPMTRSTGAAFEGSTHGLMGDLIRQGITGAGGYIDEPQLQSVIRPDVLFEAYLSGRTLVDAFYLATPHLSWHTVIVGDPLCAPFATAPAAEVVAPLDADTELPAAFAARRTALQARVAPDLPAAAIAAWVRATGMVTRGDRDAAPAAYERAIALAPKSTGLRLELAMVLQSAGNIDGAITQYEQILQLAPNHVITLNNLAYALAVDRGRPADALPLARRAVALAPTTATILDTLGWVEHLAGDNASAAKRLAEAVRRDPAHADIRLHAAVVYGELGLRGLAENELKEALRLSPALATADAVVKLREKLSTLPQ